MGNIGVMTFCSNSLSYGANLQAFALQRFLMEMGHLPELIRYRREDIRGGMNEIPSNLKHKLWASIQARLPSSIERRQRFARYRTQNIRFSKKEYSRRSILMQETPDYDAYIVGSDQVWNPAFTKGDPSWFLNFAPPGRPRISYAASFGVSKLHSSIEDQYRDGINGIDYISTREIEGQEIVKKITGRHCELLPDPTLLLDRKKWSEVAITPSVKFPYILCFFMPGQHRTNLSIAIIAKRLHSIKKIPIVAVGLKDYWQPCPFVAVDSYAGPSEFVGWIQNASYVLTNSFHATAFSIIFRKPFLVHIDMNIPPERSLASRMTTLLSIYKLEDRIIETGKRCFGKELLEIDYSYAERVASGEKSRAYCFLESALEKTK